MPDDAVLPSAHAGRAGRALHEAEMALRMKSFDVAERLARGVLKSARGHAGASLMLGRALLLQDRRQEAIDHLRGAARRSDDPAIEALLATALAEDGKTDEATAHLRNAIARRPPFPPAFSLLAEQLSKAGRLDDAVAVVEEGLALIPHALDLHMKLGQLFLRRNDRTRARDEFLLVRSAAPERHDALVAMARLLTGDGAYHDAAALFRRALGLRPHDAQTRIAYGKCLLEMGEQELGEDALRAAVRSAPRLAGVALSALASVPRGRLFLRPGDGAKFLGTGQI